MYIFEFEIKFKIQNKSRLHQINHWLAHQALDLAIPSVVRQRAAQKQRTEANIHVGRHGASSSPRFLPSDRGRGQHFQSRNTRIGCHAHTQPRRSCHSSIVFWRTAEVCACWRTMKSVWKHQGRCRSPWCRPRSCSVVAIGAVHWAACTRVHTR